MPSADERAPLIRASRASSASWTRAVALAATLALVAALAAALARGAGGGSIAPVALGGDDDARAVDAARIARAPRLGLDGALD